MRPKLTGTVGEPVVLNLRRNRTRELSTKSRIQTILVLIELDIGMVEALKLRRFSFFF